MANIYIVMCDYGDSAFVVKAFNNESDANGFICDMANVPEEITDEDGNIWTNDDYYDPECLYFVETELT